MNAVRLTRLPKSLLAAVVASVCLGAAGTASAEPLAWAPCAPESPYQCATLTVPQDYGQPAGPTIEVAVTRLPAADPARRIGSLVVNPGGPGGSGVDFVQATGDTLFATLNQRFDIVGFDPRGSAGTTPVRCLDNATQDAVYARAKGFPRRSERDQILADAQLFADACAANTGDTLRYLSTKNVARDMDRLRTSLGDEKLTYLGFSYGTYLGATYAALFPGKVRALVLDGALNATNYVNDPILVDIQQAEGFQVAMDRFLEWCELECEFGDGNPTAAYRSLLRRADETPLVGADGRPVRSYEVLNASIISLYARQTWPLLAAGLQLYEQGDPSLIQLLADAAIGRDENGQYDNGLAAFNAISNIDRDYPRALSIYDNLYLRWFRASRYFGLQSFWALSYTAPIWPARANDRYLGPYTYRGTTPVLVVGTTFDPATPYQGSIDLTDQLRNARLLTMDGDGHTAYGGNSNCIDLRVERYLVQLRLPRRRTVCKQQSTPPAVSVNSVDDAPQAGELRAAAKRIKLYARGARLAR